MIRLTTLLAENVKDASFIDRLKKYENSKGNPSGGWDPSKQKWFPHGSPEGGTKTIAYGHKLQSNSEYPNGITDTDASKLLERDIDNAITKIKNALKITNFDSLPSYVQQALVNATFRGELKYGHTAVGYMRTRQWDNVANEYLDNDNYRSGSDGLRARMEWNANQFRKYGEEQSLSQLIQLKNTDVQIVKPIVNPGQQITIRIVNPSLKQVDADFKVVVAQIYSNTGELIKKHRWEDIEQGILQFNAPAEAGNYIIKLNRSATVPVRVAD
jgi:GH24 family phage-related lysozyme (muramidase)